MRHEYIPDGPGGQWRPTVTNFQVVQVKRGRLPKCPIPGGFLYDCGRLASQILMSQIGREYGTNNTIYRGTEKKVSEA